MSGTLNVLPPFYATDSYFPISQTILKLYGLDASIVFGNLYRLSTTYGKTYLEIETFASQTGLSKNKITKAIRLLKKIGLIKKTASTCGSEKLELKLGRSIPVYKIVMEKFKEIVGVRNLKDAF
jgi:hypothetical protein